MRAYRVVTKTPVVFERTFDLIAEQKSPDLIDGKIKELDPEILWVD